MLKYQKNFIFSLLERLEQLHSEIYLQASGQQDGDSIELLVLCQTHMIRVGEMVEKSEGDTYPLIHELEMYCDQVYRISQILSVPDLCIEEFL